MGFKGRDTMTPFRAYQGNVPYLCNSNEGRDMPDSAFLRQALAVINAGSGRRCNAKATRCRPTNMFVVALHFSSATWACGWFLRSNDKG